MNFMQGKPVSQLKILSIPEQIANFLRSELANGRWSGSLPGRFELARQPGVGISSMEEALRQLERDKILASQGAGRTRQIVVSEHSGWRTLKIASNCMGNRTSATIA
jgi:DNA-binding FadR family transcriptional regulator